MSQSQLSANHDDPGLLWGQVAHALRYRVGERNFVAWIAPLRCRWTQAGLALEAPDRVTRDWVTRHFGAAIEQELGRALGHPCAVRVGLPTAPPVLPVRTLSLEGTASA